VFDEKGVQEEIEIRTSGFEIRARAVQNQRKQSILDCP